VIDLCCVGDYCWDVLVSTPNELPRGGDTFGTVDLHPGGSSANTAVWAARCGCPTAFVGKVGADRLGELAADDLTREGVIHRLSATDARPTGAVASFVDHTGERSMVTGVGADHLLAVDDLPGELLRGCRHLHLTGWSLFGDPPREAALRAAELAKQAGATVSLDPSAHQMIAAVGLAGFLEMTTAIGADIVFPNREEGVVLTGEAYPDDIAAALAEVYAGALVVLKLDGDGALVWRDGEGVHVPAVAVDVVDSTGAGDSFAGAFLARWLAGGEPVAAATAAVEVAAWVVGRVGARPPGWSR
jgi:ribokinase